VPATAAIGAAYARFRMTSIGSLGPTGFAADGKVEDYLATIEGGSIRGHKWNDVDGDGVQDAGEPGLEGWRIFLDANLDGTWDRAVLTDQNGDYLFAGLGPAVYRVSEQMQVGWARTYPTEVQYVPAGTRDLLAVAGDVLTDGETLTSMATASATRTSAG